MTIQHVLAVVPVSDIDAARSFYAQLFGRDADNNPMPSLVEWQVLPQAWVQVTVDENRAGRGQLNLAVDDLDTHLREVGMSGEIVEANKGVRLCTVSDPDGNQITFLGGFRVEY
ncbi:VOC family protein [Rhodococcoides trifolii]|nr:VOC family protein [Rhodococcus trifolii]